MSFARSKKPESLLAEDSVERIPFQMRGLVFLVLDKCFVLYPYANFVYASVCFDMERTAVGGGCWGGSCGRQMAHHYDGQ